MVRPRTDPVVAEREALKRVAELASHVMVSLRRPGRGKWDSEHQLRSWLTADGVTFTVADIAPALTLLEATKRIVRGEVKPKAPRPGWLARDAELWAAAELSDRARVASLIDVIIRVLGQGGQCQSTDELQDRLVAAGYVHDPADLPAALERLVDSGRMVRPEGRLVMRTTRAFHASEPFSRIDDVAADVVACTRRRGTDQFDSDVQLVGWLTEDGVTFTAAELGEALLQLQGARLLVRPVEEDRWTPQPGYLTTPSMSRAY